MLIKGAGLLRETTLRGTDLAAVTVAIPCRSEDEAFALKEECGERNELH